MNYRLKKKKIPYGAYCHGSHEPNAKTSTLSATNNCPWFKNNGTIILHRDIETAKKIATKFDNQYQQCPHAEICDHQCWSDETSNCSTKCVQCTFKHVTDNDQNNSLFDGIKICGVKDPNYVPLNIFLKQKKRRNETCST